MKILVPYCPDADVSDYRPYQNDIEIYGGFSDERWSLEFGSGYGLNRMSSFGEGANLRSFRQWLETVQALSCMGIPVYTVFNGFFYDQRQISFIRENYLKELSGIQKSGIITGCVPLIRAAHELGLRTSVSTIGNVYNAYTAALYEKNGADSIIVPRELTADEIRTIIDLVPGPEYEAFILGSGCRFSDGSCVCTHIPRQGGLCQMLDLSRSEVRGGGDFSEGSLQRLSHQAFHGLFMRSACGLCALYRLMDSGVTKFKVVGRSAGFRIVEDMLVHTLENQKIAEKSRSEADYLANMKIGRNMLSRCVEGYNCYYPEIRFPRQTGTGKG